MKKLCSVALILLFTGCAGHQVIFNNQDFTKPLKVAVLPFANETNDIPAGELFRLLFELGLKEKGFKVMDQNKVDKKLQEIGITDGGQLTAVKQKDLMKALGTKSLVYGTLKKCNYVTTGLFKKKEATGNVQVYHNGEKFFEDERTLSQKEFRLDPTKAIKEQMTDKFFEKALAKYKGHPFYIHIESVVYQLQDKMPGHREEKSGW